MQVIELGLEHFVLLLALRVRERVVLELGEEFVFLFHLHQQLLSFVFPLGFSVSDFVSQSVVAVLVPVGCYVRGLFGVIALRLQLQTRSCN